MNKRPHQCGAFFCHFAKGGRLWLEKTKTRRVHVCQARWAPWACAPPAAPAKAPAPIACAQKKPFSVGMQMHLLISLPPSAWLRLSAKSLPSWQWQTSLPLPPSWRREAIPLYRREAANTASRSQPMRALRWLCRFKRSESKATEVFFGQNLKACGWSGFSPIRHTVGGVHKPPPPPSASALHSCFSFTGKCTEPPVQKHACSHLTGLFCIFKRLIYSPRTTMRMRMGVI